MMDCMSAMATAPIATAGGGNVEIQLPTKSFAFTPRTPSVTLAEEIHVIVTLPESVFNLSGAAEVQVVGFSGSDPAVDAATFYTDIDPVAEFGGA